MKAALAYLRRPMLPTAFHDAMVDLALFEQALPEAQRVFGARVLRKIHPPYPNTGRNQLTAAYLDQHGPEVEAVLMMDDDNIFEPWQPRAIVEMLDPVHRPIISGLYFAYDSEKHQLRPLILRRRPDGGYEHVWHYREGLEPSDAVGMGFCAIHRSCLEEWRAKHGDTWFDYGTRPSGAFAIEDESFCVRMQSIGKSIHVHTQIQIGHMKLVNLGADKYVPLAE